MLAVSSSYPPGRRRQPRRRSSAGKGRCLTSLLWIIGLVAFHILAGAFPDGVRAEQQEVGDIGKLVEKPGVNLIIGRRPEERYKNSMYRNSVGWHREGQRWRGTGRALALCLWEGLTDCLRYLSPPAEEAYNHALSLLSTLAPMPAPQIHPATAILGPYWSSLTSWGPVGVAVKLVLQLWEVARRIGLIGPPQRPPRTSYDRSLAGVAPREALRPEALWPDWDAPDLWGAGDVEEDEASSNTLALNLGWWPFGKSSKRKHALQRATDTLVRKEAITALEWIAVGSSASGSAFSDAIDLISGALKYNSTVSSSSKAKVQANALWVLGEHFLWGTHGARPDVARATRAYSRLAAMTGNASAHARLGFLEATGWGRKEEADQAKVSAQGIVGGMAVAIAHERARLKDKPEGAFDERRLPFNDVFLRAVAS